ncbi:Outer membrane protein (porin) [Burkholderia vietnamiensis]|nr:putative porin [Burkholderia vietnamiensis]SCZ42401.1 Outer membrane protein (porin) [Burkholderia vietnamiensis]SFY31246.1 Outer membrane protein (porin) [Burkholderia vietnamiensis]
MRAYALGIALSLPAASAHAQSSVTLYGELDAGVAYVNNVSGHSQYLLTSGLIDGSYWGIKGSEDLGGGFAALFRLERGYSVATGEDLNDHPFYVGLDGESLGTVTFGHQYDMVYDYFAPFTLTGGNGGTAFAHPFDNDNANNSYLASNSVKYTSANLGGFSFGAMYAFSNRAGAFAENRAYGLGANYAAGPFKVGAAWMHVNGRGEGGTGAYDTAALPGTGGTPLNAAVGRQDTFAAGASYSVGDVTVAGAWSRVVNTGVIDADSGAAMRSSSLSNYEVNATWQLTETIALAGMYTYTAAAGPHWHTGALQCDYTLSKRTDLYIESVYLRGSSGSTVAINGIDPSSGRNQLLVATGIRHKF